MDYENTWTNCDEPSGLTAWRSTQQYPPSYFPGAYASVGPNLSFPDESLNYASYSPSPYTRNDMNGNNRHACHPHHHNCFGQTDDKGPTHFQPFHNIPAHSSDVKGNRCCESVGCQHQNMRTYLPQPCKPRSNMKHNSTKQYFKKKRKQTYEVKNQNKKNYSVVGHNVFRDNFTQESFEQMTHIPHSSMNSQYIAGDNAILEFPTNPCAFQQKEIVNLPGSFNDSASSMTQATGLNMESIANFQDKDKNAMTCTNENVNYDAFNISEDFIMTDVNSLQPTGDGLLPGKLQMEEVHNTNSEQRIIQSEVSGYTAEQSESGYTLQSVFEGKDEDGKDIIFLLAIPEMKQENTGQFSLTDLEAIAQCTGTEGTTDSTGNVAKPENDTLGNESCSKDYTTQVNQGIDNAKIDINDIFFSSINDFASEETVEASVANTRQVKTKQHTGSRNKQLISSKQKTARQLRKTCFKNDCATETADSRNKRIPTNRNTHVPWVKHKCRNYANANRLGWKSHFKWKSRDSSFKDLQNAYFRNFMRKFRAKNMELDRDDVLQKMLRVILNKVGGSVMESVYKTFHEIIAIYTRDKNTLERENKRSKPLQVKFSKQ